MTDYKNLKPFVAGDERINRRGRPRSYDILHTLALRIAGEPHPLPFGVEGETRVEALLRAMCSSQNPRDRELFLQYAYGKLKNEDQDSGSD